MRKKKIVGTEKLIRYLIKEEGGFSCRIESSDNGLDVVLDAPEEVEDKLMAAMVGFDQDCHFNQGLPLGDGRRYKFYLEKSKLRCRTEYSMTHYFPDGNGEQKKLPEILKNIIEDLLAKYFDLSPRVFRTKFFYSIRFESKKYSRKVFVVIKDLQRNLEIELARTQIQRLKKNIFEKSQEFGGSSIEADSSFSFDLSSECIIIDENWLLDIELGANLDDATEYSLYVY